MTEAPDWRVEAEIAAARNEIAIAMSEVVAISPPTLICEPLPNIMPLALISQTLPVANRLP